MFYVFVGVFPDDTSLFWGIKHYNNVLMEVGPLGNIQGDFLLQKNKKAFTFKRGWEFP